MGSTATEAEVNDIISSIAKRVGINTADDFYNTIGFGGLSLQRFLPKIKDEIEKLKALMKIASKELDFERCIEIRDTISQLKKKMITQNYS